MRSLRHWTPRYLYHRVGDKRYRRANPEAPWLTPQAIGILHTMLRPTDTGLEFGSGRSTVWFATRVHHLTSVEHDEAWHEAISTGLKERGLSNVDYLLCPRDVPAERGGDSDYVGVAARFPADSLDFVLVDGAYREHCALAVIPKLRPGGLLVIDNVNWFLPSRSHSPCSRTPAQGPAGPGWRRLQHATGTWRSIWTSSGVWDTALFVKPTVV